MNQHLAVELLSSYLDKEVTQAQLRLVEGHLRGCSECRGTLAGLGSIAASVRRLEKVAPPSTLASAVERRVRLASLEKPRGLGLEEGLKRWLGQPVLAPVFAIVVALGAILYLFALGVSELGQRSTRLVVASAPVEEDQVAADGNPDSAPPLGGSESDRVTLDSSGARTASGMADLDPAKTPSDGATAKASGPAPAAEPVGGSEAPVVVEERTRLLSKSEVIREEAEADEAANQAVVAGAVASPERSSQRRDSSRAGAGSRAFVAQDSTSDSPKETRLLAGRSFVKEAGLWIEVGLEGRSATEFVNLRTGYAELDEAEDLAAFQDLERVRLRIGDRIVEVIYPPLERKD